MLQFGLRPASAGIDHLPHAEPTKLLADLSVFDGKLGDWQKKANAIMLIFLLSEALRFDSDMLACVNWLTGTWTMRFTDEIKARVKDWGRTRRGVEIGTFYWNICRRPDTGSAVSDFGGNAVPAVLAGQCPPPMATQGCSQSIFPDFRTEAGGSDDLCDGAVKSNSFTTQRGCDRLSRPKTDELGLIPEHRGAYGSAPSFPCESGISHERIGDAGCIAATPR